MRRISTPTAAQDLFGPGKHGFRNGDPANAILATRLQAEWFNALQEEVSTAVEQSGAPLDPVNNGQLSAAIEGVVDRKAPVATKAEAEESVEANANNTKRMTPLRVLQAIKKNLVAASELVVGMLRVGTQSEVNAGVLDDVAVTPRKLRAGFSLSLATNGFIAFPTWLGGLILQWGQLTQTSTANGFGPTTVTLPLAFPTAVLHLGGNLKLNSILNGGAPVSLDVVSLGQISIVLDYATGSEGTGISRTVYWLAIGN